MSRFWLHTKNCHIAAFIDSQMYLIYLMELQYSTFMCVLYALDNKGE